MPKAPYEVALRVYESVHGQELLKAEHRTRERVRQELNRLGLGDQFERLFSDDETELNRVRGVLNRIIREEVAA